MPKKFIDNPIVASAVKNVVRLFFNKGIKKYFLGRFILPFFYYCLPPFEFNTLFIQILMTVWR